MGFVAHCDPQSESGSGTFLPVIPLRLWLFKCKKLTNDNDQLRVRTRLGLQLGLVIYFLVRSGNVYSIVTFLYFIFYNNLILCVSIFISSLLLSTIPREAKKLHHFIFAIASSNLYLL